MATLERVQSQARPIKIVEVEYHAKLMADIKQAEQMQVFIQRVLGARDSWLDYLRQTYNLKDGDSVELDGTIKRGSNVRVETD